jgi:hypothetical protein
VAVADTAQVTVSGKSDAYDKVLGKLVEKNKELAEEFKKSKDTLESMNPIYEKLAVNAQKLADALKSIKPLSKDPFNSSGGSNSSRRNVNDTNQLGGGYSHSQSGGNGGKGSSPKSGGKGSALDGIFGKSNSLSSVTSVFGKLGSMGMSLFNKMKNLLFSFDEVISIPLFLPPLPNFPDGKGGGGGGNPATKPALAPTPVPASIPAALPFAVKNPFATWEPAFAPVLARIQAGLNGLKFPQIFPGLVTIPVLLTGLEPALVLIQSVTESLKGVVTSVDGIMAGVVAKINGYKTSVDSVWQSITSFFQNPYVQGTLAVLGVGATILAPEVMLPLEGMAAEGAMGAGVAMTGARVAASGGRMMSGGRAAWAGMSEGASSLGSKAAGLGSKAWDYSKGLFQGGMNAVPSYATGGFHVKPHLGVIGDVKEVTLPLNGSASVPAFKHIGKEISGMMGGNVGGGGGVSHNFEIHVAEGSNIIADQYSIKRFATQITEQVQYNLRNTGSLGLNRI